MSFDFDSSQVMMFYRFSEQEMILVDWSKTYSIHASILTPHYVGMVTLIS